MNPVPGQEYRVVTKSELQVASRTGKTLTIEGMHGGSACQVTNIGKIQPGGTFGILLRFTCKDRDGAQYNATVTRASTRVRYSTNSEAR